MAELHDTTGGNPRFVTEALANGRPAALSPTLTEALLAQSRAEGDWGHRVLVAASVLEQPFEPEPLADLLGADAAELTEELERLCERRILRDRRAPLPLPLRPRAPGAARQHLARPATPPPPAARPPRSRRQSIHDQAGDELAGRIDADATRARPDLGHRLRARRRARLRDGPRARPDPRRQRGRLRNCSGTRARSCSRRRSPASTRPSCPSCSELLERVLRDGRASTIKLTCRTKHGTFLPTEISLHALEIDGRLHILGLVQDRSEHRQRRRRRLSRHTGVAQPPSARSPKRPPAERTSNP